MIERAAGQVGALIIFDRVSERLHRRRSCRPRHGSYSLKPLGNRAARHDQTCIRPGWHVDHFLLDSVSERLHRTLPRVMTCPELPLAARPGLPPRGHPSAAMSPSPPPSPSRGLLIMPPTIIPPTAPAAAPPMTAPMPGPRRSCWWP